MKTTTKDPIVKEPTIRVVMARVSFHAFSEPQMFVTERTLWDAAHAVVLANPAMFVPVEDVAIRFVPVEDVAIREGVTP